MRTRKTKTKMSRVATRVLLAALILGWLLAGCSDKKTASAPAFTKPKAAKPAAEAPVAVAQDVEAAPPFIYSPVGKRDPFRSKYKLEAEAQKEDRKKGPLELYEITQLKLTAIISGISSPRAQVVLPDGKGMSVALGTRIGKNGGKVVRIKHDEVVIAEEFKDPATQKKVINYLSMRMTRDEGEKL